MNKTVKYILQIASYILAGLAGGWGGSVVMRNKFPIVQYACAVCLIISSIMMVAYQVLTIADVANGLLMYVAQAFLLAGSIFGLDYYVKKIKEGVKEGS